MTTEIARRAGSWVMLTAKLTLFAAASGHLVNGVVQTRIESLMAGGCLMFGAMLLAWLRVSISLSGGPKGAGHLNSRADWMLGDPA